MPSVADLQPRARLIVEAVRDGARTPEDIERAVGPEVGVAGLWAITRSLFRQRYLQSDEQGAYQVREGVEW